MTSDPERPLTVTVANPRWLDGDEEGPHVNHSRSVARPMPVANGMPLALWRPSARLQLAVVGLRGRHLYGNTRRSALGVTMVGVAGRGSDAGRGVGARHSFAELRKVASEECPTGITDLGVQPAAGRPAPARVPNRTEIEWQRTTVPGGLPLQLTEKRTTTKMTN